jgi:hypothetical protein
MAGSDGGCISPYIVQRLLLNKGIVMMRPNGNMEAVGCSLKSMTIRYEERFIRGLNICVARKLEMDNYLRQL